ncbi:MAG: helix-turn-helix transcriptional regulator [Eggerthellaceae bacterium]|nr:helix-turn-helix transcriptional regulator [Eggerthellaceae bacterium]
MASTTTFRKPPAQDPKESLANIGEAVKSTFGANLKQLLNGSSITREAFCEMVDISSASLANYINGKTLPPVDKLIFIARMFNVELQDLIQHDIGSVMAGPSRVSLDSHNYPYYCGSYAIHYFNTSQAPGHENHGNDASVDSGVLVIRNEVNALGSESYPALCVMGVSMRNVTEIKAQIDKHQEASTAELADILAARHAGKFRSLYYGHFVLNGPQAVVHLSKPNSEITITMQNVALEVNKDSLRCNIGVLSSVSHGNYHLPFAQKVLISAVPLTHPIVGKEKRLAESLDLLLGPDEIATYLNVGSPQIDLSQMKRDFVRYIKGIYATDEESSTYLSELDDSYKEALVMCFLEDAVRQAVSRNAYRAIKVDGETSNALYADVCAIAKKQGLWVEGGK